MDKYLGNFGWNELTLDEQELIGHTMHEAPKIHLGWLTQENSTASLDSSGSLNSARLHLGARRRNKQWP